MSLPDAGLDIEFVSQGVVSHDAAVDAWELRAARRTLRTIKALLSRTAMEELIAPQIAAADAYYKHLISESGGRGDHVGGGEFQKLAMQGDWILTAHPEHYMIPEYDVGIVEVVGQHMARVRIRVTADVPEMVMAYGDPSYPVKKPTVGELGDGTVLFYILHEFRDTPKGCDIILRLLFPAAAPDVFVSDHAQHLSIEFRSFIPTAYGNCLAERVTKAQQ